MILSSASRKDEYVARVNRVIDFIEMNIDGDLSLDLLSGVAGFSSFHFHRIFKAVVNEPLNKYIQRIRLEKAANQLSYYPGKSITDIAFDCGFSSSQFFARLFKEYFNQKPSEWRIEKNTINSKIIHTESKILKDTGSPLRYCSSTKCKEDKVANVEVEIVNIPDMTVAYVRNIGPYKGDIHLYDSLFSKLFKWAAPRNLLNFPETKVLSLYNDNPCITDESKLRVSACITVPADTKVSGPIGKLTITGGKYAAAHFELSGNEFESAWDSVYSEWLPESGYVPDDKPAFEVCLNDPHSHPEGKHFVDICIPVKPL